MEELLIKRIEVLKEIEPICNIFNIKCDYIVSLEGQRETLVLDNKKIACTFNSIEAIKDELIAYIFVTKYCNHKSIGTFQKQTLNYIKRYWLN